MRFNLLISSNCFIHKLNQKYNNSLTDYYHFSLALSNLTLRLRNIAQKQEKKEKEQKNCKYISHKTRNQY
ncbi:hypothetical protein BpHYR1_005279 [Brachionus plicatilis]|uniref:Uncharacterized protein n=1 Tax=Brachionus plicatilis TaxID=10195 RepID=A0A3M7P277_BRAPC|nr:hypothetical protein BpHYR1_005279 [Brachionus plicatilis]